MTHKNFSFWFCTLLSGVVIGIASQRIPEARAQSSFSEPHPYSFYCNESSSLSNHAISSLAFDGYHNSTWVYEHFKKDSLQGNKRSK